MIPAILSALGSASVGVGGAEAAGVAGASAGIESLTKSLGQLQNTTSQLNPSMQKLVGTFTAIPAKILEVKAAITQTADAFVQGLAAPIDTIKQLGDSISRFVRLSNPAAVTLFEYKVENALSGVGKILEPILNSLGRAADKANLALSKLAPAFEPLVNATVEVVESVSSGLVPAFRELAPLIKLSGETTHALVAGVKGLAQAGVATIPGFQTLTKLLARLVGGVDEGAGQSVAARQVNLSSIEQIQREGAKRSIMATLASEQGGKKPETTESLLSQIYTFLKSLTTAEGWAKVGAAIAEALEKRLPQLPGLDRRAQGAQIGVEGILGFLR